MQYEDNYALELEQEMIEQAKYEKQLEDEFDKMLIEEWENKESKNVKYK